MTEDRLPLAELMAKTGDTDFLRAVAESVLPLIMEADVEGLIGAGRFERSAERATWRNGHRVWMRNLLGIGDDAKYALDDAWTGWFVG